MCKQFSKKFSHNKEKIDWINLVIDEKRIILSKVSLEKNPIQILMKIFELCMENFYNLSLEENFSTISNLVEIFEAYKEEIKSTDCELYYGLLNFVDMLKTTKGKRLYFKVGFK